MKLSAKEEIETREPEAPELIDPLTGEILEDVDSMIDSYERLKKHGDRIYAVRQEIARRLAEMTEGELKTRRLRGKKRAVKITMPDSYYSQPLLKEAWNSFPGFAPEYLRIDSIGVKKREVKKLEGTTGEKDFEMFKSLVQRANQGPGNGTPRISIEE